MNAVHTTSMSRGFSRGFSLIAALFLLSACSSEAAHASGRLPSDEQVIEDVTPKNDDALISVS